ncbi:MAG: xylulokinase [Aggregatilineales bacterium]
MPRYFLGLDVSTTASKALIIDETGQALTTHSRPHRLSTPRPLWSEQDPEEWAEASFGAIRVALADLPPEARVEAIGLTGQMHGLTLLDADGKAVRPAILWNDQRSGAQCESLTAQVGAEKLYRLIGSRLLPGFTIPKLIWVREHEPGTYARIASILLPKDYVRWRLSGARVTDVADGSGIGLVDVARRAWSEELIQAWNVPRAWLPELCESTAVCATVSAEGAAATGLTEGTPIVGGAGDQPAQAVGSGIVAAGQASVTVGTSGVVFAAADRYAPEPDGRLHTFCHALPGAWFSMGVMLSAAGSLRWFHDTFTPETSYEGLSDRAAESPRGSLGLLFAPYLSGERHPHPDPLARGALVGLTAQHTLAHCIRSVMEGVAFGMRDNFELFRAQGLQPESAALSGGAANSPVWRQIMAEVLGIPLYTVNTTEGAAFGAAILGAVGIGAFPDVPTACAQMIRPELRIEPEADGVALYERLYGIYREVYPALQKLNVALADVQ